jgi:hypothetical protein
MDDSRRAKVAAAALRAVGILTTMALAAPVALATPTLTVPGPQQVMVGNTLRFTVYASHPYNVPLTLEMTSGPGGATFTIIPNTNVHGTFEYTPSEDQVGTQLASFRVVDTYGESATARVYITVIARSDPPVVEGPRRARALPGEMIDFNIRASDPNGDPFTLSLISSPLGGEMFTDHGDGTGTYSIVADAALAGTTQTVVFQADDGLGGVGSGSTELFIGARRGENRPRLDGPRRVVAPAGSRTEVSLEALDDDLDDVMVSAQASGLAVAIEPGADGSHRVLVLTPTSGQAGTNVPVMVTATDPSGRTKELLIEVEVPATTGVEVTSYELRWSEPPASELFSAPASIEMFAATSVTPIEGDPGDLLGYAIYCSTEPGFEPSEDTLFMLAGPTSRNGPLVLTAPLGKSHVPFHVKATARHRNGESGASKESSSDLPRFTTIAYKKGKLQITASGSNLAAGAAVEVRQTVDGTGERFNLAPNKSGSKWVVKKTVTSTPGNLKLSDLLRAGQIVYLVLWNPNGKASIATPFTP